MNKLLRKIDHFFHPVKGYIVMLHRVTSKKSSVADMATYEITPTQLDELLSQYKQQGYIFVSMDEVCQMQQTKRYHNKFVALTLDDGYLDNMVEALPVFRKYNCPFCIYMTSSFVDSTEACWWYPKHDVPFLSQEQLRHLAQDPLCTIGAHTITHPYLSKLTCAEKKQEIVGSKQRLEEILGLPVYHFAYPYGDFDEECVDIVREIGFHSATKVWDGGVRSNSNIFALPRIKF